MRIGILGGGQLGRMLVLAGAPLGLNFRIFEPSAEAPAAQLAPHVCAEYDDFAALYEFVQGVDVVTYEFENVPLECARWLAQRVPVYPPVDALRVGQERLREKDFFTKLGIPTPAYVAVDTRDDLRAASEAVGLPAVLKTRQFGYDGKGQMLLRTAADVETAWERLGGRPLIYEAFVPFTRELSQLAVRSTGGELAYFAAVENVHRHGILYRSRPLPPEEPAAALAREYARRILSTLDYVGVLAVEFFDLDGHLLANEMAPRVHNSGHWTIEGAVTSQFAQHLRAILGLPLGSCETLGWPAMLNLIGSTPSLAAMLAWPRVYPHLYGKKARPGRKLGHITIVARNPEERDELLSHIERLLDPARSATTPSPLSSL